jgi:hypothetical protein
MADVKISELPSATALAGADSFPIVQSGATKQITATAAFATVFASPPAIGSNTRAAGAFSTIGIGGAASPYYTCVLLGDVPEIAATSRSVIISQGIPSSTVAYYHGVQISPSLKNAAYQVLYMHQFQAAAVTRSGSSATVRDYSGYAALDQTATWCGTTYCAGFTGQLTAASNKYNLYMSGTAQNYLAGELGIGTEPSSTTQLTLTPSSTVKSSLRIIHGVAPSSPVDGDMWTTTAGLFVRVNGSTVGPLS